MAAVAAQPGERDEHLRRVREDAAAADDCATAFTDGAGDLDELVELSSARRHERSTLGRVQRLPPSSSHQGTSNLGLRVTPRRPGRRYLYAGQFGVQLIVTVSRFMNVTAGLPCCILKRT